jgi:acyl-CoA thioesterase-1
LIVGDSLSAAYGISPDQGWVALLGERIAARGDRFRIVNASVSGDTTRAALARMPAAIERHRPVIVIIELGGNDGLRGVPIAEFESNLRALVDAAGAARVVLAPVALPQNYGPAYTGRFIEAYRRVADATGARLTRMLLDGIAMDPDLMQDDGIHPRARAQPRMLENVWPEVEAAIESAAR